MTCSNMYRKHIHHFRYFDIYIGNSYNHQHQAMAGVRDPEAMGLQVGAEVDQFSTQGLFRLFAAQILQIQIHPPQTFALSHSPC